MEAVYFGEVQKMSWSILQRKQEMASLTFYPIGQ